jgi:hypothetical protein
VIWTQKGRTARAIVAEDGSFRLAPICAERSGTEVAMIEDLEALKVQIGHANVLAGKTVTIQIGEPAGHSASAVITGRVTAGGEPLPGVFIITRTVGAKGGENFVRTARDGTYRRDDVAPGQVMIQICFGDPRVIDDFTCTRIEPLELGAGNERVLDFDLPGGAFLVTVVDDETGEPIPGAVAFGKPMDREAGADHFPGFRYQPGWGLRVGEDGSAVLLAMLPGEPHRLEAGADGYQIIKLEDRIPGKVGSPAEITIRLKKKD